MGLSFGTRVYCFLRLKMGYVDVLCCDQIELQHKQQPLNCHQTFESRLARSWWLH